MANQQGLQQRETLATEILQHQHNQQHQDEEEEEEGGSISVRPNVGIKRRYSELMCESDEDDFAGFDEDAASSENGTINSPRPLDVIYEAILTAAEKKLTENNKLMEDDSVSELQNSIKQEDMDVSGTALNESNRSLVKRKVNVPVNTQDDIYKVPFKYGWKRELVYRANMEGNSKDKGEVYYITPSGKKLRTRNDIVSALHDDLTMDNFTFAKEPVGGTPEEETIRSAKSYSNVPKRSMPGAAHFTAMDTSGDLGKRVPKPKMPKGASPPLPSYYAKASAPSQAPLAKSSSLNTHIPTKASATGASLLVPASGQRSNTQGATATMKGNENSANTGKQAKFSGKINKNSDDGRKTNINASSGSNSAKQTNCAATDRISDDDAGGTHAPSSSTTVAPSGTGRHPSNFLSDVSAGYTCLMLSFNYLKVQELLRACSVCRMWNHLGNHPRFWKTVRMKNSYISDWAGMIAKLRKNGTKHLDLRKVLNVGSNDEMWQSFNDHIGQADQIEVIDLCRCSSSVVGNLLRSNPNLRVVNALAIKNDPIDFVNFEHGVRLEELRLKSSAAISLEGDLHQLAALRNLKHLSLTSISKLGSTSIEALGCLVLLESLELGECTEMGSNLASVLTKLTSLKRLRLEKGQENCDMFTILNGISKVSSLTQLELINCDVKLGFDRHIVNCTNVKKLLLIPTYVSQSAATNRMVLKGIIKLHQTLETVIWAITVELLRVTELYIDANVEDAESQMGGSIPILKPVPGSDDPPSAVGSQLDLPEEVEIVPLKRVDSILKRKVPNTKLQILKIPFNNTWKQTMCDSS
ncbi:uncharacterized protein LOC118504877 isoform X3 [Anopheles stephensi]|uniref:uncharacterized protein LOC118504877 isoform X3 n=1 Tax=Anopheles stephensi TaxID=30069 RepID=UPI0016588E1F|nr:uncharacterized protein LOC118504877 isoform X3 [Anopheles stephensi]